MRTGIGYDIHRLVSGRRLVLGGVEIPYVKGLLGHSDADVLLHAISDALLGAAGAGDIGEHFPDTGVTYKDISSIELLKAVYDIVKEKGFLIENVDATLIMEEPRIAPFKNKMIEEISKALGLLKERINIKATTAEGVGQIGSGQAIAAVACVSIEGRNSD